MRHGDVAHWPVNRWTVAAYNVLTRRGSVIGGRSSASGVLINGFRSPANDTAKSDRTIVRDYR